MTAAADEETLDLVLEDHDTDYEIPDSKDGRRKLIVLPKILLFSDFEKVLNQNEIYVTSAAISTYCMWTVMI